MCYVTNCGRIRLDCLLKVTNINIRYLSFNEWRNKVFNRLAEFFKDFRIGFQHTFAEIYKIIKIFDKGLTKLYFYNTMYLVKLNTWFSEEVQR